MIDSHCLLAFLLMHTYITMGALPETDTGIISSCILAPLKLVSEQIFYLRVSGIPLLPSWDIIVQKVFFLGLWKIFTHMKIVKCITILKVSSNLLRKHLLYFFAGTIYLSACQDVGAIRGREQNESGSISFNSKVHVCSLEFILHMFSADLTVLWLMHAVQYWAVLFASNECGCLGQDLCCGISCHPSRLMQCTRPSSVLSVSTEISQTLKELMITSMATDSQAFFTNWRWRSLSGALILPAAGTCSAGSIQGWG